MSGLKMFEYQTRLLKTQIIEGQNLASILLKLKETKRNLYCKFGE